MKEILETTKDLFRQKKMEEENEMKKMHVERNALHIKFETKCHNFNVEEEEGQTNNNKRIIKKTTADREIRFLKPSLVSRQLLHASSQRVVAWLV